MKINLTKEEVIYAKEFLEKYPENPIRQVNLNPEWIGKKKIIKKLQKIEWEINKNN